REQARLLEAVLAGRRVDRQEHLVRRARDAAGDDAVDLAQLVHQVTLGVQPPGGVDDDDVAAAGLGGGDRIEGDRGRIAAGLGRDEVGLGPLRPRLELLAGGGAERVVGADHARAAGLAQVPGDLADRRRLARAVHAAHEQDGRMGGDVDAGIARRRHQLGDDLLEPAGELLRGRQPAGVGLRLEPLDDRDRGGDAAVGQEQRLLEPLPHLGIGGVEHDPGELLGHCLAAEGEVLAEAREEAAARLLRLRFGDVVAVTGAEHRLPCARHGAGSRSEEHTSELQSLAYLVCRLLLEKKNKAPYLVLYLSLIYISYFTLY